MWRPFRRPNGRRWLVNIGGYRLEVRARSYHEATLEASRNHFLRTGQRATVQGVREIP